MNPAHDVNWQVDYTRNASYFKRADNCAIELSATAGLGPKDQCYVEVIAASDPCIAIGRGQTRTQASVNALRALAEMSKDVHAEACEMIAEAQGRFVLEIQKEGLAQFAFEQISKSFSPHILAYICKRASIGDCSPTQIVADILATAIPTDDFPNEEEFLKPTSPEG
jgi:hypothetical protein